MIWIIGRSPFRLASGLYFSYMFASELTYLSGNLQGGLEMNIAKLQSEKEFWLQKEVLCIG